jgi:hypothetical protein
MGSIFRHLFQVSTFGESHGGHYFDGLCPASTGPLSQIEQLFSLQWRADVPCAKLEEVSRDTGETAEKSGGDWHNRPTLLFVR